jgi:predicted permease
MRFFVDLLHDVRYAVRQLIASPGLALVCTVSLGIGIGLNTSIYSQFRSTVFHPVPQVADPGRVVLVQQPVSYPNYEQYRDHGGQFQGLSAYIAPVPFVVSLGGAAQRVWGHIVTPDYFETLGVRPHLGRLMGVEERDPGRTSLVLSHRLWQSRFGADPRIVGRRVKVNGQMLTAIGVAPPDFLGPMPMMMAADLWIPTTAQARVAPELGRNALTDRKVAAFALVGRLKPGVAMAQAEIALDAQARAIEQLHGDPGRDRPERRITLLPGGRLVPVRDQDMALVTAFPIVLVGLTLWIACSNVATMLLARAAGRRREIAIRLSMGASRWRVIRQMLTESVMLAALGGVAGYFFAVWSQSTVESFKPFMPNYVHIDLSMDWTVFAFTAGMCVLTGVLFGLAPALQATRADLAQAMKAGALARMPGYRWYSSRNILVLQQVAGSLTLLLLTGFIVLGFRNTSRVELGFDERDLYLMSLDPVREGYSPEKAAAFFDNLPDRVRLAPGVAAASLAQTPPLGALTGEESAKFQTEFYSGKITRTTRVERVGAAYFETMGIRLAAGRDFRREDVREDPRALVINEALARDAFGGKNAIGQTLEVEGKRYEVVGVAVNVHTGFILQKDQPAAYLPMEPSRYAQPSRQGVTLVVRGAPGADAVRQAREAIAALDPELTVFQVRSIGEMVRQMLYLFELTMVMYGGIGLFGLVLAATGLAGVTAYAVARRSKEIGIRIALGALPGDVLKLVLREGVVLAGVGTAIGLAAAFAITRALASYLELLGMVTQTSLSDPLLVVGAPALLVSLTLLACYLPARRSTKVNPVSVLREE